MKTCTICGNPIPDEASTCPFCEKPQAATPRRGALRGQSLVTVNLERGRPSVRDAISRLDMTLATGRLQGVRVVRVVHGYGSSGKGGRIKRAVGTHLKSLLTRRAVAGYVHGEDYADSSPSGRRLLQRCPRLKRSYRADHGNAGITLVEL